MSARTHCSVRAGRIRDERKREKVREKEKRNKMPTINVCILLCVGLLLAGGDFAMKTWSSGHESRMAWYVFAILLYVGGLSVYGYMLRSVDFAAASYSILIFNMIFVAVAGYIYFDDTLSYFELAGIILGITSVAMFTLSKS
jgi:drug/metabolite transporter (DMT)-like permease